MKKKQLLILSLIIVFAISVSSVMFAEDLLKVNLNSDGEKSATDLTGDIIFSVPGCTFKGQVSVALSSQFTNAEIRYTIDGSIPTSSSTVYKNALSLTTTTQLRAQAFVNGVASGAMGTAIYIASSIDVKHDLPVLILDAYGGGKPARDYKDVAVMLMEPKNNEASLLQTPTIATRAGFHVRGQSSANFAKTPYRLELWNNENKDAKYPILGMPADGDWALLSPYPDKSLIRNALAYGLGEAMGLKVPRYAFVEVYLNLDKQPLSAADYQGVYLLAETIEIDKDRLDIKKLKEDNLTEPDITGGYLMQFNMMAAEAPLIQGNGWSDLEVSAPNDLQSEQLAWITKYIQKVHDSIHSTNPSNPQTGYPAYIDVGSFVNYIIQNELAREGDSYMRSTYIYKDRNQKLMAGPLWDYDLGYDCYTGFGGWQTSTIQGWQYQSLFSGMGTTTCDWYNKLMHDSNFQSKVCARWQELRKGPLSDAQLTALIKTLTTPLANAAKRNFQKWNILNTANIGGLGTQTTQTWEQQLTILQNFLLKRAAWLDTQWKTTSANTTTPTPARTSTPTPTRTSTPTSVRTPTSTPARTPTSTPRYTATPVAGVFSVSYSIGNDWGSGATVSITIKNNGTSAINGWNLAWSFSGNQKITNLWNGIYTQSGTAVTVNNAVYNSAIPAKGSVSFGFNIFYNGSNVKPAGFTVNGSASSTVSPLVTVSPTVTASIAPTPSKTITPTTIKIMPLGDSITDGMTVAGGYRIKLWSNIKNNGSTVDFVGSMSNGPAGLGDKNHEGHSGWRIDQIDAQINAWMDSYKPQIVLLHIGTNDVAQNYNMANASTRLSALIDKICAKLPAGGKLYVATIVPLSFGSVTSFNLQISQIVINKSNAGKPVYLVEMYSALTTGDLADGVHPNLTGYNKMADVWFKAIRDDLK